MRSDIITFRAAMFDVRPRGMFPGLVVTARLSAIEYVIENPDPTAFTADIHLKSGKTITVCRDDYDKIIKALTEAEQ